MELLDVVRLVSDLPDPPLPAGSVGTIVDVHERPTRAYEVEFTDRDGRTVALVSLTPDQIRPA